MITRLTESESEEVRMLLAAWEHFDGIMDGAPDAPHEHRAACNHRETVTRMLAKYGAAVKEIA